MRVAWAVETVGRKVPLATCLVQATAVEMMLRRAGENPTLHIGVTSPARAPIEAHAWLEWNGRVIVGDEGLDRFAPLSLPPSP
jgi:hypothetical protein